MRESLSDHCHGSLVGLQEGKPMKHGLALSCTVDPRTCMPIVQTQYHADSSRWTLWSQQLLHWVADPSLDPQHASVFPESGWYLLDTCSLRRQLKGLWFTLFILFLIKGMVFNLSTPWDWNWQSFTLRFPHGLCGLIKEKGNVSGLGMLTGKKVRFNGAPWSLKLNACWE